MSATKLAGHSPGKSGSGRGAWECYAHLELFDGVDFASIGGLLDQCHEIFVDTGETLLEAGSNNASVYLVINGELEVCLLGAEAAPIVKVASGSCVGELSILNRLKVSAQVTASRPSRLLVVPGYVLWLLTRQSHEFAMNMLSMLSGRVQEDNARLLDSLDAQHRYQKAAKVDHLTGLFNRRWFEEIVVRQWRRAVAEDAPLSVLFIDIDHFKAINDEFGHLAGDTALRAVSDLLQSGIRPMDLAARFGGEEFAIVMFGITIAEARQVAERLRREIEAHPVRYEEQDIYLTVSVGVGELESGESINELIRQCDAAMYRAKAEGRNRVMVRAA